MRITVPSIQGDQIGWNFAIWAIFYGEIFSRKNCPMIWAKFWPWKNCPKLTLIRLKFCPKRGFLHVSKIFKKLYLLFYVKKTIKECPVPLDISIKSNRNTIKQFYIVNLTKTWSGDFLGDFSLSFFTKTSGHTASIIPFIWIAHAWCRLFINSLSPFISRKPFSNYLPPKRHNLAKRFHQSI